MNKQTEHELQSSFISWCNLESRKIMELSLIFSIPNGSNKSITTAMKFKREGLKSGIPDLFLPVARGGYHGLFMEWKRSDKEKLKPKQIEWNGKLTKQGYFCVTVSDVIIAEQVIKRYLRLQEGEK